MKKSAQCTGVFCALFSGLQILSKSRIQIILFKKETSLFIDHDLPDHPVVAVTKHHGIDPLRKILQVDGNFKLAINVQVFERIHIHTHHIENTQRAVIMAFTLDPGCKPAVVRVRPDADRFLEHIVTLLTIVHYYIGGPGCGTSKTIAYRVADQLYSNAR